MVLGIHWGSWNSPPMDKGGYYNLELYLAWMSLFLLGKEGVDGDNDSKTEFWKNSKAGMFLKNEYLI